MKCLMWLYSITFNKKAQKELERLPLWINNRIILQIEMLIENPYPNWHKKLKNFNITWFEWLSLYELRIEIIRIGHRKEIYDSH